MTLSPRLTKTLVIALALLACVLFPRGIIAEIQNNDAVPVIEATESLFKAMKERNYPQIWSLLTQKSHEIIIDDVRKAIAKAGTDTAIDSLQTDFASGGRYAREYWDAYLNVFDPGMVLEQSKWEMGKIGKNESEIILRYRKSDQPAILKIYKENDSWKVGLEETFRSRRLNIPEFR
ncbi:MAG: hypothetical protein ACXWMO_13290 [Syntrophales bacterium]